MSHTVEVMQVLAARDRRVSRQRELLKQYGAPLISFTMNIAGPVKRTALIDQGFELGLVRLEEQLARVHAPVLTREIVREDTGCEALYVAALAAPQLKELCVLIEEADELGRLFDMDVLDEQGRKLEREGERGCLLCGQTGRGCARSRRHSVAQLQARTQEILHEAVAADERERIGELACRALLYEVCTAPKPGLVDRRNSGSHTDMDIFTFMASSAALQPYFARCAAIGQETAARSGQETFAALRSAGKLAEGRMLRATDGCNTHKGAVFILGLLCGALGRVGRAAWKDTDLLLRECSRMAEGLSARELPHSGGSTAGERYFTAYGLRGVRGEAEDGFPSVRTAGLPTLCGALMQGKSREQAGCEALLALMCAAEDTALVHRAGYDGWQQCREYAAQLLHEGVSREKLLRFDEEMIRRHWSPGGCADLLAMCWLLYFLREEGGAVSDNEYDSL